MNLIIERANMTLSIQPVRIEGIEMWAVVVGGEIHHTFFSESGALFKLNLLKKTIGVI